MTELLMRADAERMNFKDGFIERYKQLTDWDVFKKYSCAHLRKSIRVNTLKISVNDLKERLEQKGWELEQVPWCKEGFWLKKDRIDIGNLLEHTLGYIYVQEAASMIPPVVLDPKPGETVLDMCAAPGSKTTQIGMYMNNKGVLIANDLEWKRATALGINVQRMGLTNCALSVMSGVSFEKNKMLFDKVLVDAPCSATGTIRKSLSTLQMWNPKLVQKISRTQRKLMSSAFNILKPGGVMVYSTCTLEPEENEGNISWLLDEFPDAKVEQIQLNIVKGKPVTEFEGKTYNDEVKKTLRIWPQDNDTEGFFIAKITKKGE